MELNHSYPGKFIILEGCEGAGKTTLIPFLKTYFEKEGYDVVATKEPDCGTKLCRKYAKKLSDEKVRLSLDEMLNLLMLCRAENYGKIVIPALEAGMLVFDDRGSGSTYAYQHYGYGMDLTEIMKKDAIARRNVGPDLVLLLDIPVIVGLNRKKIQGRFEKEPFEFHQRVRDGYLQQLNDNEHIWRRIDAKHSAEIIQKKAIEIINQTILPRT